MVSQVHVKIQPADCSQSKMQDGGIGMIDFNFPAIVTKTVVYDSLRWSVICCAADAFWGSTGIRTGPVVVHSVVVAHHGLNLHQYADDTQVYISTSTGNAEAAVGRCLLYTSDAADE